MDYKKLKSLVDEKDVAVVIQGGVVRVNHEIGNNDTWVEFEVDGRGEEQIAALINTHVSKIRTGKISQV